MIQKGIIESLENSYQVKVRIPKYDKTTYDGTKNSDLSTAIICTLPGSTISYDIGDVVLVGFENDELSKPVVLGTLYRKTDASSTSLFPHIDDALSSIKDSLDIINSSNTYTHIKYSNDNGKTFTSLYDYSDVKFFSGPDNIFYYDYNIRIDGESTMVIWSILNDLNYDVTSDFIIKTYIHDSEVLEEDFISDTDRLNAYMSEAPTFTFPANYYGKDTLYLSFKIISASNLNNYYISLATDKDSIGSVYGDYIGFCVDTKYEDSYEVTDYSWSSAVDRNNKLISSVIEPLRKRLEETEQSLYGYNKSTAERESDGTGIEDGISVSSDNVFVGALKNNVYFDSSQETYINVNNKSIHTYNLTLDPFTLTKGSSGHLTLVYEKYD